MSNPMTLLPEPHIKYIYDDKTENLLDQYSNQLKVFEALFENTYGHLMPFEYSRLRDQDPAMMAILDVIAKIYEQAIPISIDIKYAEPKKSTDLDTPSKGISH